MNIVRIKNKLLNLKVAFVICIHTIANTMKRYTYIDFYILIFQYKYFIFEASCHRLFWAQNISKSDGPPL